MWWYKHFSTLNSTCLLVHLKLLYLLSSKPGSRAADTHNPSVALKWVPPTNCKYAEYVSAYQICLDGWMCNWHFFRAVGQSAHYLNIWDAAS